MSTDAGLVGRTGLQFFGRMGASISHDIKNVLAVVNENAGLLEDLCAMADRGKPVDLARLKRLAADVKVQVRRGDGIVSGLNRLAHSADAETGRVELTGVLELLAALSLRFISMQGLTLKVTPPAGAPAMTTLPFFLLNLLWLCLEHTLSGAGPERMVEVTAEPTENGACFRFRRFTGPTQGAAAPFPDEAILGLCRVVKAEVRADPIAGELRVILADLAP